jgi:peptide/nickel transport system substrate-binding protein
LRWRIPRQRQFVDWTFPGEGYNHENHGPQESYEHEETEQLLPLADRRRADGQEVAPQGRVDIRTGSEQRRKWLRRAAYGVVSFCTLVSGCNVKNEETATGPVVLRIGVPEADVSAPDMGMAQIVRSISYEGLTGRSNDGRPIPLLAESWSSNPDGLRWNIRIRNNVTFHDGVHLSASIARESLLSSVTSRNVQALYPGLADIDSITPEGDHELVIALKKPSSFLLDDLSVAITRSADKKTIGTGPFKQVSESEGRIEFEPHPAYYLGKPKIDRIVVTPYPALRTAWASLMRDEIDMLWDVAQDAREFVQTGDVETHSYLRHWQYLIAFNSKHPKFAAGPVRRALNAAVDRTALIKDVLKGRGLVANGPFWPLHWAYDQSLPGYTFDPSLAATTLQAVRGRVLSKKDAQIPRLSFVCILPENRALWERIGLNVQKQLYDAGVDMQLQALPADEWDKRLRSGNFEASLIEIISGPSFARAYQFWRSTDGFRGLNVFGYHNPQADRWFDALRYSNGEAEYRAAAGQVQRVLLEDPPALFLAWNERTRAVNRRFHVPVEPGRDPIATLWKWAPRDPRGSTTH